MRQLDTYAKTKAFNDACENGKALMYRAVIRKHTGLLADVALSPENIADSSVVITQSVEGDGGIPIGSAAITSCEIELIGDSKVTYDGYEMTLKDLRYYIGNFGGRPIDIYAGLEIGSSEEWLCLGQYYVVNEHLHYGNYRLMMYDAMAYLDTQQIESASETNLFDLLTLMMTNTPITAYRNEIDEFTGANTISDIKIPGFTAMTKREFLKYICELFCAFCYVDFDGVLVFRTITSDAREPIGDGYGTDHQVNITDKAVFDEDYGFIEITGFRFTNPDFEIDEILGTDTYLVEISNPFFQKLDSSGRVVFNMPEARTRYGILINASPKQRFITGRITRLINPLIERGDLLYRDEWLVGTTKKRVGDLLFATQITMAPGHITSEILQSMEEPEYKDLRVLTGLNVSVSTISGMVILEEETAGSSVGVYTLTIPSKVSQYGSTYGITVQDIDGGEAVIRSKTSTQVVISGTTIHRVRYTINYGPGMA